MIWACFSYFGKSSIAFLNGCQSSVDYCNTLQNSLWEFTALNHGVDWQFQQGGVPIHVSRMVKMWFNERIIDVIDWPAKSLDLNRIENL